MKYLYLITLVLHEIHMFNFQQSTSKQPYVQKKLLQLLSEVRPFLWADKSNLTYVTEAKAIYTCPCTDKIRVGPRKSGKLTAGVTIPLAIPNFAVLVSRTIRKQISQLLAFIVLCSPSILECPFPQFQMSITLLSMKA